MNFHFDEYLHEFEQRFVLPAARRDQNPIGKMIRVPITKGKLAASEFGVRMGLSILSLDPIAVDYYGYLKFSEGLLDWIKEVKQKSSQVQIRTVEVKVVHFNAIRLETVLAVAPQLGPMFARFKKTILDMRFPGHSYKEE